MIELSEKKGLLIGHSLKIFDGIVGLPTNIRPDEKERTGIQVLVRVPGTRNLVFFSVGSPSEFAQFFAAEKAVRSDLFGHTSSETSQDWDEMRFPGSVTVKTDDAFYQASVSGLKAEEDVFIAIKLLSLILKETFFDVYENIAKLGGELPECLIEEGHYLCDLSKKA